jgi:hypothetical protein
VNATIPDGSSVGPLSGSLHCVDSGTDQSRLLGRDTGAASSPDHAVGPKKTTGAESVLRDALSASRPLLRQRGHVLPLRLAVRRLGSKCSR